MGDIAILTWVLIRVPIIADARLYKKYFGYNQWGVGNACVTKGKFGGGSQRI